MFQLVPESFETLPGWRQDHQDEALRAFQKSCEKILKRPRYHSLGKPVSAGKVHHWHPICQAAKKLKYATATEARHFFEKWFTPMAVKHKGEQGLFTGYYIPTLQGSLHRHGKYQVPIYALPKDLVTVSLGNFRRRLHGYTIRGRYRHGHLMPYYTRAQINRGVLTHKAKVLVWADSRIDRFFLQIQGSGFVKLEDGRVLHLAYGGSNGRPYTPIGRWLFKEGIMAKENISMQSIRDWLRHHSKRVQSVLNHNQSFVFFRLLNNHKPQGTQEVPLTPGRSLAVDSRYVALSTPIWLDTKVPSINDTEKIFQQLVIAQDTGSAVNGPIRGDIYWGSGDNAAYLAGHMKNQGRCWLLLPKQIKI